MQSPAFNSGKQDTKERQSGELQVVPPPQLPKIKARKPKKDSLGTEELGSNLGLSPVRVDPDL